jgi:hypothetical protein
VFNATFSNISAISWRPVLVVEGDYLLRDFLLPDKEVRVMVFNAIFNNISVIS